MALKKATSTAKTAAKKTAEVKAEPVKAAEKAVKAEPAKAEAKAEKAEPAKAIETKKDTTKKLETKAAVLVDTPAEKAEEKKTTTAKKTAAKKETAKKETAKKTTAKKTVKAEKPAVTQNVYVQFAGLEISTADLTAKVTEEWVALGHRASSIKSLDLYVKPEDMAAYYVINGKESGKIAL